MRSTWILKGRRQEVTPGQNERRTIFGALELATGRWFYFDGTGQTHDPIVIRMTTISSHASNLRLLLT